MTYTIELRRLRQHAPDHRPVTRAVTATGDPDRGRGARALLALAAVAVAFAAADTYVVVLALPDMMTTAGLVDRRAAAGGADRLRVPARVRRDAAARSAGSPTCAAGCRCWSASLVVFAVGSAGDGGSYDLPEHGGRAASSRGWAAAGWCRPRWPWSRTSTRPQRRACRSAWSRLCRSSAASWGRCSAPWCWPVAVAGHLLDQPRGRAGARRGVCAAGGRPAVGRPDRGAAAPATGHVPGGPWCCRVLLAGGGRAAGAAPAGGAGDRRDAGAAVRAVRGLQPAGLSPLGLAAAARWCWLVVRGGARPPAARRPCATGGPPPAQADLPGASLARRWPSAGIVLAFATADPEVQVFSPPAPWWLLVSRSPRSGCVLAPAPGRAARWSPPAPSGRRPRGGAAWSASCRASALIAALVDVPLFARVTAYPDSQLGAALVLLRLLAACPSGAVLGGLLHPARAGPDRRRGGDGADLRRVRADVAVGRHTLDARPGPRCRWCSPGWASGSRWRRSTPPLLASHRPASHGVASAFVVVSRMVGMLVGISALTTIGLRLYYAELGSIPPPREVCGTSDQLPGLHRPAQGGRPRPARRRLRRRRRQRGAGGGARPRPPPPRGQLVHA